MSIIRRWLVVLSMIAGIPGYLVATHIVGGELYYQCLGSNMYRITFKLYRDGCPTCYIFDHPSTFYIFNENGYVYKNITFDITDSTQIPPTINNPCLAVPPDVIVWGIEKDTVVYLAPGSDYYVVYQRCCRNNTIVNILDPGGTGSTYVEHIPDPATMCNSSPSFDNFPPIALCVGDSLKFDHSATDPDGDSLVYSLCTPNLGADQFDPKPTPPLPPPYGFVTYVGPYSSGYPIDASPPLAVHPSTGLLTGTPTAIGQYVVAVCVSEYRNGVLIGEHKRDFQFNIIECDMQVIAAMPSYILECDDFTVNFSNNSVNGITFSWDFGDGSPLSNAVAPLHTYADTGIYYVTLIANPGYPCADTANSTVKVYPGLVPDFSFASVCAGDQALFTNLSYTTYGTITNWQWGFGDGFTSTQQNPSHIYATGGNYSVSLTVVNTKGCIKSITKNILIYPLPQNNFSTNTPCEGDTVFFTNQTTIASGSIILWVWNFGNEGVNNEQHPWFIFSDTGVYPITLTSFSDQGCSDTLRKNILVQPVPVSVAGRDTAFCHGDTISIGVATTPGYSYVWSPATGIINPANSNPKVTLTNDTTVILPFSFIVTTGLNGCFSSDTVTLEVFPDIKTNIPHQPGQCLTGNNFNFTAEGVYGTNANFLWDFGLNASPNTSSQMNPPNIQFTAEGNHVISLTIYDNGCLSTDTDTVNIYAVPVASFELSSHEGCDPFTVYFNDKSITEGVLTYTWDFGDGSTSADANPVHTYSPAGTYTVSLAIELELCKSFPGMTASSFVLVNPKPGAGFTAYPHEVSYFNPYITFTENASGVTSCVLYFGDGTSSPACDITHEYPDTGNYRIMQVVENSFGCTDTTYDMIRILPEFTFYAPVAFTPNMDDINEIFFPKGIGIAKFEMWIYDRWGDQIFYTDDLNKGWDGRSNRGKEPAQQDVYVYIVKLVDVFKKEHRYLGRVTLVK